MVFIFRCIFKCLIEITVFEPVIELLYDKDGDNILVQVKNKLMKITDLYSIEN